MFNSAKTTEILKQISPLPRMINSPGMDRAFSIIKANYSDMNIHEYNSGLQYEDWVVPESWEVISGIMKDSSGNIIASTEDNLLFVAPYSEPVEGNFTKEEIANHLRTNSELPHTYSLEHKNAYDYNLNDWGITLPHDKWCQLPKGDYFIDIKTKKTSSTMKVAAFFKNGKTKKTITFCAHIDELCNDDLSGCVVALELIDYIKKIKKPVYNYQILIVPEAVGTMFYIYENIEKVKSCIGVIDLETVGAGDNLYIKKSLQPDSYIEKVLISASHDQNIPVKMMEFFEGYGNDERIFEWPQFHIPGVALQRYPFKQYHTSDDVPDIINNSYLEEVFSLCTKCIDILETNYIPQYKNILPPWLTKRNLYFHSDKNPEKFKKFNNIVLYNVDGKHSVLDIAKKADLHFSEVLSYLDTFHKNNLIDKLIL